MLKFKVLADVKHEIFDDDLHSLMIDRETQLADDQAYRLEWLSVVSQTGKKPLAQLKLKINGSVVEVSANGDGAVDAIFKAINQTLDMSLELLLYSVSNVTDGTDAQGEVGVRIRVNDQIINGIGMHTDILVASASAYLDAINRTQAVVKSHPQLSV